MGKEWTLKRRARPTKKSITKVKSLAHLVVPIDPLKKKKRNPKVNYKYNLPDSKGWYKKAK